MGKLIDADKLKRKCQKTATEAWKMKIKASIETTLNQFMDWIERAEPVDAVPVVRCAVCRHFQCNMRGDGTLPQGVDEFECRKGRDGCDPIGFCDEGKRKDGDGK